MGSNKHVSKEDATIKLLEDITQNHYSPDGTRVKIQLSGDSNHYDHTQKAIHLNRKLFNEFFKLRLPRFCVFYHELGHYLYSEPCTHLLEKWTKNRLNNSIIYHQKYFHLINWLEDYYIEWRLLKEYPYLTDVLQCIKKLKLEYDINAIEYTFNYYYLTGKASPALSPADGATFTNYIQTILTIRINKLFGTGVLSVLTQQNNPNMSYIRTVIEFYNWCVSVGIFPPDTALPALSIPSNVIVPVVADSKDGDGLSLVTTPGDSVTSTTPGNKTGAYTDYSKDAIGRPTITYVERTAITTPIDIFKDIVDDEERRINTEYIDIMMKMQTEQTTLSGLFNARLEDTAIIQPKVIVKNFFNPNRLQDQVLFQKPTHTYKYVNVYRDISGSTNGTTHTLINEVCKHLQSHIPVNIGYYLYSSGQISIMQVAFIDWPEYNRAPTEYVNDPIFRQLSGGTNSGAIANVITEQLSDNWLNIIITDGDLYDLMRRDNISALLKNVFVVVVGNKYSLKYPGLCHIYIEDYADINLINNAIMEELC